MVPLPEVELLENAVVSVWLIEISSFNWFIDNIWPTMVVGSMGDVGSCDCISVTSNFRKVLSALCASEVGVALDEAAAALAFALLATGSVLDSC